jgi:uncharacterized HhH-GPD family protein
VRVGLVGCVKSKQPRPAPARDLYTSALFRGRRAFVESTCDQWFILSAKHGLLAPDELIEPYDVRLADKPDHERQRWSRQVVADLERRLGDLSALTFEIHAGAAYRDNGVSAGLRARGATVENPVEGLNQGQQLAFYKVNNRGPDAPERSQINKGIERSLASLTLSNSHPIDAFSWRWPDGVEEFERGWAFDATTNGVSIHLRHGLGRRDVFGRNRVHSVTWVENAPTVEGAEAEDYAGSRALISVIKRADGKAVRSLDDLPSGYEQLEIVVHRDEVVGPMARSGLAVKIREDDLHGWALHALLKRENRSSSTRSTARPAAGSPPIDQPTRAVDRQAVAEALLDFAARMAVRESGGTPSFAPDPDANRFLIGDSFAFLVAVICDEGVRAEWAWAAPYGLRQRLGHWDLERIANEPDQVRAAFEQRPALHRMPSKSAARVVAAARRVLEELDGDAGRIWASSPTARQLFETLDSFDGIGQKKAAMAVEILERDLHVPLADMTGSDIAYDVHVRRVFLRTGLAERDDPVHMVAVARETHSTRPGALDFPAWLIGRQWCRPRQPLCDECVLALVCPRLIERGDDVRGM